MSEKLSSSCHIKANVVGAKRWTTQLTENKKVFSRNINVYIYKYILIQVQKLFELNIIP